MDRTGVFESHHRYAPIPNTANEYPKKYEEYEILNKLGEGGFATVHLARPKMNKNKMVALKVVKLSVFEDDKWKASMLEEVELINLVKGHPHILECFASFQDQNGSHLVMVLEYADGGDLNRYINDTYFHRNMRLPERLVWHFFDQISSAISYMHEKRLLHRDLKPANVMITSSKGLKVCNFGLGRLMPLKTKVARKTSEHPTTCRQNVLGEKITRLLRMSGHWVAFALYWSISFIGERANEFALQMRVKTGEYPPIPDDNYTDQLNFLVEACLHQNKDERPTAEQVQLYASKMNSFFINP